MLLLDRQQATYVLVSFIELIHVQCQCELVTARAVEEFSRFIRVLRLFLHLILRA
jgi:hypothetical protein